MAEEKRHQKDEIHKYVYSQIQSLLNQRKTGRGKARLANLRKGAGKVPGELPELWGEFLNEIPEDLIEDKNKPSKAEWAIYLSLTMFAVHQQGNNESVHSENISLGRAAAQLIEDFSEEDHERQRILHRFGPIITAKNMPELSYHLRNMIKLFRAKGVNLDYAKLAEDIFDFQSSYGKTDSRKHVQLRWAEDFYYKKGAEQL